MKTSRCSIGRALYLLGSLLLPGCSDAGAPHSLGVPHDASLDATPQEASTTAPCPETDGGLPTDLFCTGLYDDGDPNRLASGVLPYTPGVTLWSDGAQKQRYLLLPAATQIDTSDIDSWRFPVGTKAWKQFRVDDALVETRLFWKRGDADWLSGTYVWDAKGEHATLNTHPKGTILPNGYEIPSARDCGKCHHGGADSLLGVEAIALALPTAQGVTLASLASQGKLSHPPTPLAITLPEDATQKAGQALGFLHANCGMPCHSARGLGEETQLRLRLLANEYWPPSGPGTATVQAGQTDVYRATIEQSPTTASVAQAFPQAQRIAPGSHDQSLLWLLAHRRDSYQMPPLVSHRIDEQGTQALAEWIDALVPPASPSR